MSSNSTCAFKDAVGVLITTPVIVVSSEMGSTAVTSSPTSGEYLGSPETSNAAHFPALSTHARFCGDNGAPSGSSHGRSLTRMLSPSAPESRTTTFPLAQDSSIAPVLPICPSGPT